ncbi:cutinase-domain-containing protein [Biscogniauxia marginata]|nr:cutinase-domain-containing protein [Biscogniauxia marginata]
MKYSSLLLNVAAASMADANAVARRQQSCPNVQIFGARETTAPPGFGSAATVVNLVQQGNPGSTSESIIYPAAGGNSYASSVTAGVAAIANQTSAFNQRCPNTKIVMVGYSQGAQITDDAFCGGPDGSSLSTTEPSVSSGVRSMVAAIILMGNPRHVDGLPFNVGNATEGGFAARPVGFSCPEFEDIIQAYCDAEDPFCAKGTSMATHQGYGFEYGQQAFEFVQEQLSARASNITIASNSSTSTSTSNSTANGATPSGATLSGATPSPSSGSVVPVSGTPAVARGWTLLGFSMSLASLILL